MNVEEEQASGCKDCWSYWVKGISHSGCLIIAKCLLMCSHPLMLSQVSKTIPTWQMKGESFIV